MDNSVIITNVTPDELTEKIRNILREELGRAITLPSDDSNQYLTRRQVAAKLDLSLPTVDKYSSLGIIKGYKIGTRILFREREVDDAVSQMSFSRRKSRNHGR